MTSIDAATVGAGHTRDWNFTGTVAGMTRSYKVSESDACQPH
jgi:hypothetical protein